MSRTRLRADQRGITLVIALIALIILSIGAVAMVRSTDASQRMAGNLAFKRDLANQSERAIAVAMEELRNGALESDVVRESNRAASNYSAAVLLASDEGIPNVLLDDSAYTSAGFSAARDINDAAAAVSIRYVIDRLCSAPGSYSQANCQSQTVGAGALGGSNGAAKLTVLPLQRPVYRISVRVSGPRGTQTFTQTTVTL